MKQPLRLLFLTNFYPPANMGGYEEWCQEVADGLRKRGHELRVLTSRYGRLDHQSDDPTWVHRELHLEMEFASLRNGLSFFTSRHKREADNLTCLQQQIDNFQPDWVVVWGMWNLSWSLPALAESLRPDRVAYYLGDYWPTLPPQYLNYWQYPAQNWLTALPKWLLSLPARWLLSRVERPSLTFPHALFCSHFLQQELQQQGVAFGRTQVVPGAVDTRPYFSANGQESKSNVARKELKLLYVGRLRPDKGIETAVQALDYLVNQLEERQIYLHIVGQGEPAYERQLRQMVNQAGLSRYVTFSGVVAKSKLAQIYHQADVLLFTSIWQEPFGRVIVEAQAAGLVVVGTATGGAAELLLDEETGLHFTPERPQQLARQIQRLRDDPALYHRLAQAGQTRAVNQFDLKRMVQQIEAYLCAIHAGDDLP
jgi:glycogen synthase